IAGTKDEEHYALNRFDGHRFHPIHPNAPSGIPWGPGWSQIVVHSRSGDWWLATGSGLLHYASDPRLTPQVGLIKRNIFRIFEDSRGALWASVHEISNHGLYRRKPGMGHFESFDKSHGLPSLREHQNLPSAFVEDGSGQLWIGMLNGGLVRFRNGKFQQCPSTSVAPDQGVRAFLVDRMGRLWFGTRRRGLLRDDDTSRVTHASDAYT